MENSWRRALLLGALSLALNAWEGVPQIQAALRDVGNWTADPTPHVVGRPHGVGMGPHRRPAQGAPGVKGQRGRPVAAPPKSTGIRFAARVLLADGRPVEGARIYVTPVPGRTEPVMQEAVTDAQGRLPQAMVFPADSQQLTVMAIASTGEIGWTQPLAQQKSQVNTTLRLQSAVTVTGRVLRLDGSPAVDTPVMVARLNEEGDRARLLPDAESGRLFATRTLANGVFSLPGLPRRAVLKLKLGDGSALAPGSTATLSTDAPDAGVLIAFKPGALSVSVTDRDTGQPAPGVTVAVIPADLSSQTEMRIGNLSYWERAWREAKTNARGAAEFPGLLPVDSWIVMQGMRQRVTVREGSTVRAAPMAARQGPVELRILDEAGRPAGGLVDVDLDLTGDERLKRADGTSLDDYLGQSNSSGTDEGSRFSFPESAWRSPTVHLLAVRGTAVAEWSGRGDDLPRLLELRLRPNVFVRVSGRLVDPKGKPVALVPLGIMLWRGSPEHYISMNSSDLATDAQGRFRIDGLPRNATFSFVPGGGVSGDQKWRGDFLSPKFTTAAEGAEQDIGTLKVRIVPGDDAEAFLEEDADQFRHGPFLMAPTSQESVAGARDALARYNAAIEAGDLDTIYRLTSRASEDWLPVRTQFMLFSTFRRITLGEKREPAAAQPLRFVPRQTLAGQLLMTRLQQDPYAELNLTDLARELSADPDWVYLAYVDPRVITVGAIAHREPGGWRIARPFQSGWDEPLLQVHLDLFAEPLSGAAFSRRAPVLSAASRRAAALAAQEYLQTWSRGEYERLRGLTSPDSPDYSRTAAGFKKRLAYRWDQGRCPLTAADRPVPQPVGDLTVWETGWLATYPIAWARSDHDAGPAIRKLKAGYPGRIERGEIAVFRYQTGDRRFLIILRWGPKGWRVLEPALSIS